MDTNSGMRKVKTGLVVPFWTLSGIATTVLAIALVSGFYVLGLGRFSGPMPQQVQELMRALEILLGICLLALLALIFGVVGTWHAYHDAYLEDVRAKTIAWTAVATATLLLAGSIVHFLWYAFLLMFI